MYDVRTQQTASVSKIQGGVGSAEKVTEGATAARTNVPGSNKVKVVGPALELNEDSTVRATLVPRLASHHGARLANEAPGIR